MLLVTRRRGTRRPGLVSVRISSRASARDTWTCMIDADHTATSLVSGSRRFSLVIDKVITFTMSVTGSRGVHRGTARVWCASRVVC